MGEERVGNLLSPEEPTAAEWQLRQAIDLFLSEAVEVDPATGEIALDEEGNIRSLNSALLVRWDEVEYLEFEESGSAKEER